MRYLLLAFLLLLGPNSGPYKTINGFLLPDPKLTPGAVRSIEPEVYCHQRTSTVRHTSSALKDSVYKAFKVGSLKKHPKGEIDHLVPLELGGADVKENLWFQPAPEFYAKDSVENWARKQVCAGLLNGVYVQALFKTDWTHLYLHMHRRVLPWTPK